MQKTLLLSTLLLPLTLSAADRATDYETVRRIAQRDPKVRAAYAAADKKLAERIVAIDPTLAGYTPGQPASKPAAKAAPAATKPVASTASKTSAKDHQVTHAVASGETLGSIAAKYGVTTAALQSANKIADPRKLAVGQKLVVPGGKKTAAKPAAQAKPATNAKEKSWWDKVTGA